MVVDSRCETSGDGRMLGGAPDEEDRLIETLDLARERADWNEICDLVDALRPDEVVEPGYFAEGWSAKDMTAHIGTWLAEAGAVLEQIRFGTYEPDELDIEALNRRFLEAMRDVEWEIVRAQAAASRARLLREWAALPQVSADADMWVRKAGPEHYAEHLPRLREWVRELTDRRAR